MQGIQKIITVLAFAGGALIAAAGLAQAPPVLPTPEMVPGDVNTSTAEGPNSYGTAATTVIKIQASAFRSQYSTDVMTAFWDTGMLYRESGNPVYVLHAPVQLPAGALVTQVGFDGWDVDLSLNINWGIFYVSSSSADTTGHIAWYTSNQSGGSFSTTVAITPHTVDPGNYYFAMVELPKLGSDLRIKGMRVVYKLQVSPAPVTATFSDVPTNHWAFQFVEALAASGITSGCAAGQFCPNNPITRAEMAVFLSAALGLHWPN